MAGVPGFGLDHGEVRLYGASGTLLPVRDAEGHIQACQIRRDNTTGGRGKYVWLSSASRHLGCSPGTPVHVARPGSDCSEIWIVEGALKADIAALRLGRTMLAVAGVGNWHGALPILRKLRPERVVVAFDMDKTANQAVRMHLDALLTCLVRCRIRTFEADWDSAAKGLDDLLGARHG